MLNRMEYVMSHSSHESLVHGLQGLSLVLFIPVLCFFQHSDDSGSLSVKADGGNKPFVKADQEPPALQRYFYC